MTSREERDLGTTRWFGASWDAPVCMPATHVPTPVGACVECERLIVSTDRGLLIPHVDLDTSRSHMRPYHLDCFLRQIGLRVAEEVLGEA